MTKTSTYRWLSFPTVVASVNTAAWGSTCTLVYVRSVSVMLPLAAADAPYFVPNTSNSKSIII